MQTNRRVFLMSVAAAGTLAAATAARAQAKLDPKDAQATALGYVEDGSKIDTKKQTKYVAGSACANCALYQATGACPLFGGKIVSPKGWCTAYAKKA